MHWSFSAIFAEISDCSLIILEHILYPFCVLLILLLETDGCITPDSAQSALFRIGKYEFALHSPDFTGI